MKSEYIPWLSTAALAIWTVYMYVAGRAQRLATLQKTKQDISDAIIERLREELADVRQSKAEIIKSNMELITMNKDLINRNEAFTNRIHELEIEVKNLKNELLKAKMI